MSRDLGCRAVKCWWFRGYWTCYNCWHSVDWHSASGQLLVIGLGLLFLILRLDLGQCLSPMLRLLSMGVGVGVGVGVGLDLLLLVSLLRHSPSLFLLVQLLLALLLSSLHLLGHSIVICLLMLQSLNCLTCRMCLQSLLHGQMVSLLYSRVVVQGNDT